MSGQSIASYEELIDDEHEERPATQSTAKFGGKISLFRRKKTASESAQPAHYQFGKVGNIDVEFDISSVIF